MSFRWKGEARLTTFSISLLVIVPRDRQRKGPEFAENSGGLFSHSKYISTFVPNTVFALLYFLMEGTLMWCKLQASQNLDWTLILLTISSGYLYSF